MKIWVMASFLAFALADTAMAACRIVPVPMSKAFSSRRVPQLECSGTEARAEYLRQRSFSGLSARRSAECALVKEAYGEAEGRRICQWIIQRQARSVR